MRFFASADQASHIGQNLALKPNQDPLNMVAIGSVLAIASKIPGRASCATTDLEDLGGGQQSQQKKLVPASNGLVLLLLKHLLACWWYWCLLEKELLNITILEAHRFKTNLNAGRFPLFHLYLYTCTSYVSSCTSTIHGPNLSYINANAHRQILTLT